MDTVCIRVLQDGDSLDDLTALLHLAYEPLGRRGFDFNGVDQPVAVTAERVRQGVCLVASAGGRLVGTVLVHGPFREAPHAWLAREDTACIQQFAVHPEWQGLGIGCMLLSQAETCATEAGYRQVALDTAIGVGELVRFYESRGYGPVGEMQWPTKAYRSVVMSKSIGATQGTPCGRQDVGDREVPVDTQLPLRQARSTHGAAPATAGIPSNP